MPYKRKTIDYIFLFIKGVMMGVANKIPGVSGGAVAFIMGFYEELIYSLQKFNSKALGLLYNCRYKSFFRYINSRFLIMIFMGTIFSFFTASKVLDYLIVHYEKYVWATFFGLILGSIYFISKDFNDWKRKNILFLLIGVLVGGFISFIDPMKENNNLLFVFFCGIISVSGMTLPGLSGSFILIILGNYVLLMVDAVNEFGRVLLDVLQWDFTFWQDDSRIKLLQIALCFILGSVVGLVSLSQLLAYLLDRYHQRIIALLIGFITGSLGTTWPWKTVHYIKDSGGNYLLTSNGRKIVKYFDRYIPSEFTFENILIVAYVLLGVFAVLYIERFRDKK